MRFQKLLQNLLAKNKLNNKIDTLVFCDPGLDDALMLAVMLSSLEHNIKGIIPGAANVPLRTTMNNTLRICELTGRTDVKVYPGCKSPLNIAESDMIDGTSVYGDDGLGGISIPEAKEMKAEKLDGVEFAIEHIKRHKTLLVSTGGLTDLSKILSYFSKEDPEKLSNIIGISIMAGVVNAKQEANAPLGGDRYTEFNILFDPKASMLTFDLAKNAGIPIFLAPLDLTHSILCCADDVKTLSHNAHPVAKFAYDLMTTVPEHYKNRFGKGPNGEYRQPLHDLHASACLLHPEIYESSAVSVNVIHEGAEKGKMLVTSDENGNVHVLDIHFANRQKFFSYLVSDVMRLTLTKKESLVSVAARTGSPVHHLPISASSTPAPEEYKSLRSVMDALG